MTDYPEVPDRILAAVKAAVAEINANLYSHELYTVRHILEHYQGVELDNWLIYRNHHPDFKEE